jgi:hypothetical protein
VINVTFGNPADEKCEQSELIGRELNQKAGKRNICSKKLLFNTLRHRSHASKFAQTLFSRSLQSVGSSKPLSLTML